MKTNYHTHTTWCDGRDAPRAVVEAAIAKGFDAIGFSSHSMLPEDDTEWVLTPEKAVRYAAEVRALAAEFAPRLRVLCGVEADYVPGGAEPSKAAYAAIFLHSASEMSAFRQSPTVSSTPESFLAAAQSMNSYGVFCPSKPPNTQ